MPPKAQAAVCASVQHWPCAAAAIGSVLGEAAIRAMRETPTNHFGKPATVRPDGRVIHDLSLCQVEAPQGSRGAWDYDRAVASLPQNEAFRPMNGSGCPLTEGT